MLSLNEVIIEVTRKCNMKCSHCLRGSIQNANIDNRHIRTLLKQTANINHVVFSGGEPSLNVEAIEYFVKVAQELDVEISSFYIVTNGKNVKIDFIVAVLKLYAICWDKESCSLQVSNDLYHSEHGQYNDELLNGLSFYSKRNQEDYARYNLLKEGRAKTRGKFDVDEHYLSCKEDMDDCEIYLNVHGQIINGCNWSYTNQKKYVMVEKVKDFTKYFENLPDEYLG